MPRTIHDDEGAAAHTLRSWTASTLATEADEAFSVEQINEFIGAIDWALATDENGHRLRWRQGSIRLYQQACKQVRATTLFGGPFSWLKDASRPPPFDAIAAIGGMPMLGCGRHANHASSCPRSGLLLARAMLDEALAQQRGSAEGKADRADEPGESAAPGCCREHDDLAERRDRFIEALPELRRAEALSSAANRSAPGLSRLARVEAREHASTLLDRMRTNMDIELWNDEWRPGPRSVIGVTAVFIGMLPELFRFVCAERLDREAGAALTPLGALVWQAIHNVSYRGTPKRALPARARTARSTAELLVLLSQQVACARAPACDMSQR